MADVLDLLKPDGYIMANKTIIKMFGLHEAILLGALCSKQSYWKMEWDESKYGKWNGFFFCTAECLEEETTLSAHLQRKAFNTLEKAGIIFTTLSGVPAKKYFKVNEKKLIEIFLSEDDEESNPSTELNPSCEPDEQLEVNQVNGNNNKYNNNKTNNIKSNNTISETKKVSQESKSKKKNSDHASEVLEIITYLNNKLGTRYRPTASAASKHIPARLEEGFTVEDFKSIIDKKYDEWHGTEWEKFLRPSTLFVPTHFEDYLNQPAKKNKGSSQNEVRVVDPKDYEFTGEVIHL